MNNSGQVTQWMPLCLYIEFYNISQSFYVATIFYNILKTFNISLKFGYLSEFNTETLY